MNKKERVLNALNNREVDRVPASFWFHMPLDMDLSKDCVKAHLDYYHRCDIDLVKIMCDGYFDYPNPVAKAVKEPEDWYKMKPLGKDHPFIREQVARAKAIVDGVNGEACVFYNVFCPMSYLRFGTSDELLMDHLRRNPDAVLYAMDVIAQDASVLCELLIREAGCTGIYYCVQNGEEKRFTAEEYRKYVRPGDLKVLEYANRFSENNILHCCGWAGDKNRMENWQDYPAKAINWAVYVEHMSLEEGKKFFGGKCVLGGFDNRPSAVLTAGSEAEIRKETDRLIEEIGKGKGYILGADCSLDRGLNQDHITWVMDEIKRVAEHGMAPAHMRAK